jgi:hypothetical protein
MAAAPSTITTKNTIKEPEKREFFWAGRRPRALVTFPAAVARARATGLALAVGFFSGGANAAAENGSGSGPGRPSVEDSLDNTDTNIAVAAVHPLGLEHRKLLIVEDRNNLSLSTSKCMDFEFFHGSSTDPGARSIASPAPLPGSSLRREDH